jgi:hypothetical protein
MDATGCSRRLKMISAPLLARTQAITAEGRAPLDTGHIGLELAGVLGGLAQNLQHTIR